MLAFPEARQVLHGGVAARVAPCAAVEVGDASGVMWREAAGRLRYEPDSGAAGADAVFDLASLTKVLATTALAMRMVDAGTLGLDTRVSDVLDAWKGQGRDRVRILDLLAHSSGLPAYRPLHLTCSGRVAVERAICAEPLDYAPGTRSVYSDLGFMLLGFILEDAMHESLPSAFDRLRDDIWSPEPATGKVPPDVRFHPPGDWRGRTAPTRRDPQLLGVVHDRNAQALDGVAGHAGMFGTVGAVGTLARATLNAVTGRQEPGEGGAAATAVRFASNAGIPGSSRALGWDTMLPSSSCGTLMSERAFGHTGFTGTSLWIDPARGVYIVLLTNRVYPEPGDAAGIASLRRALHDAVMSRWILSNRLA